MQIIVEVLHRSMEQRKMAKKLDRILNYYNTKKGNLKKCNNYHTIYLISHPSKVLLQIILSRLKTQAESIMAEEQAGFRQGEAPLNKSSIYESSMRNTLRTTENYITIL